MKKHLYLMPILALSVGSFALAGCDNKKDENAAADQTTTSDTAAPVAMESTAPAATQQATIDVSNAYAYATAEGATTGAVFVTLHNPQTNADMLTGAKADDVAASAEIHENFQDPQTGTVEMRKTAGVDIAAGADVKLEPNGSHIMLIDLKKPLAQGDTFNITLTFRNAGDVTVPVTVNAAGAAGGESMSGMSHDSMAPATDTTTTTTTTTTTAPADSSTSTAAPSESGDEEGASTTTTTPSDASSSSTSTTTAPANDSSAE